MVRRWSRINLSNSADYQNYNIAYRVHHLKVFRTTTYFKRFYFGWTKQKRRRSALKKRFSFTTSHMNILGMWAKDYRFFRHTTRFNYMLNIFTVNYLVNNNVNYANIQSLQNLKFDLFVTGSCTKRAIHYYNRQLSLKFFSHKYTKHALLHTLSTHDISAIPNLDERDNSLTPLGYLYQNQIYSTDTNTNNLDYLPQLFNLSFQHVLNQILLIYKILILTYLNTLNF